MQSQIYIVPFYEWSYSHEKGSGRVEKEGKDKGVGDWISVSSPDDLFKHGVNDIDFGKLNYNPLLLKDENNKDEE